MADSWKAIGHFFKHFAGNPARLAKLGRKLQERHLWWVIVIQVKVLDKSLQRWNDLTTEFAITKFSINPKSHR
jgi:hypothetical protein